MPALVAGIHVFLLGGKQDVDGRDKPGHDDVEMDCRVKSAFTPFFDGLCPAMTPMH